MLIDIKRESFIKIYSPILIETSLLSDISKSFENFKTFIVYFSTNKFVGEM